MGIQFPPHDAKAWSINDKTSQAVELSIDKYISKDGHISELWRWNSGVPTEVRV